MNAPHPHAPPNPDAVADYRIIAPMTDGNHGRFYRAEPPARLGLDAGEVALKVVPGGDDAAFRRFTRELRLFARVDSPYLVRLYDAGQHEGSFFYSMELCPGGTLSEPVRPLERADLRRAVGDAARAAHDLHEAGIAHRDLRPGNVLLRADGSACLADLGLAQLGSGSVTSMAPMASVGFIDPGLVLGDDASRASDIYSLGAMLHFVLTRHHLHAGVEGADPMMAIRAILRHPAHIRREDLSHEEADVIAACTDRDVSHRPATALEVAHLIDALGRD